MIYTHHWTKVRDQERKLRKIFNVDLVGARLRLGKFCGGAVLGKGELGERGGIRSPSQSHVLEWERGGGFLAWRGTRAG